MNAMQADAVAHTAERAAQAPVQALFTNDRFTPVRTDHLYHLINTVEQHSRILQALCEAHGIDPAPFTSAGKVRTTTPEETP